MKLKIFSISVLAMLALAAPSQAAAPGAPQPLVPAEGSTVEVNSTNGVFLQLRFYGSGVPVTVEAWRPGGPVLTLRAARTTDQTVWQAQIGAYAFEPSYVDSLYSGSTGTVYWRPSSICYNESSRELESCVGSISSFTYVLAKVREEEEQRSNEEAFEKEAARQAVRCRTWRSIDKRRLASARYAARKFNHAATRGERNYWHAQLQHRAEKLRQAYRNVQRYCP